MPILEQNVLIQHKNKDGNIAIQYPITKSDNVVDLDEYIVSHALQGKKGDNGESAYQTALNNGFVGTESEWLKSLKGEKGDKGDRGSSGDGTGGVSTDSFLGIVNHKLKRYPLCNLYETAYAMGITGIGVGPAGGDSLHQIPASFELIEHDKVKVYTSSDFSKYTGIAYLTDNKIAFFNPDDSEDIVSLILTLN